MADSTAIINVGDGLTRGVSPINTPTTLPVTGQVFFRDTPLVANDSFRTDALPIEKYGSLTYVIQSDQPSASAGIQVEYSNTADFAKLAFTPAMRMYTANPALFQAALSPKAKYVRIRYINGATAQTTFSFEIKLSPELTQPTLTTLNSSLSGTNLAQVGASVLYADVDGDGFYEPVDLTSLASSTNQTNGNQKTQVTNFPATQPVSGTVTANQGTSPWVTRGDKAPTGTGTSVTVTSTTTTVLAANTNRKGATIWAEGILYLLLGSAASQTNYSIKMTTGSYYEVPFNYTGIITAVGAGVVVRVSELV